MTPKAPISRVARAPLRVRLTDCSGQTLVEGAVVLPFLILVVLGVVELGISLRNQYAVTAAGREGSNLISRGTSLADAATAMRSMSRGPVDFTTNAKVVFSVIKRGATVASPNYDTLILYKRYEFGSGAGTSRLSTRGSGSFGGSPDYIAVNSDTNTGLQVTNAPDGIITVRGGMIYVTEVFNHRELITPILRFGVFVPEDLYSSAYF